MPLDITFTLSDRDLQRFKNIVDDARISSSGQQSRADIEKATYKIVELAVSSDLPDFIADRLLQLKILLEMMRDEEWQLPEEERSRIVRALAYFADPIDLIPDHIPGIGFLDDAMFVEIVIREMAEEIAAYNEFCEFRDREEERLTNAGEDPDASREEWLTAMRETLHSRIREHRASRQVDNLVFHIL